MIVHTEVVKKNIEKGNSAYHARRNLYATLVADESALYIPMKVIENQPVPRELREEVDVHEMGDDKTILDMSSVEMEMEMEMDRGLLVHTSVAEGKEATIKNQNSYKARK
ncbi:hypothetical protein QYF36_010598 [Acer negundo]|nr:hypothetical protein QYF36_010598 [Acer negundo]